MAVWARIVDLWCGFRVGDLIPGWSRQLSGLGLKRLELIRTTPYTKER